MRSRREAVIEFIKLEREAGKKIDLNSAFLSNVDLSRKKLKEYDLVGALKGASLRGAHLEGVDFSDTNLEGATFLGANLESARFFGANLIDTNLRATNLEGAMFFETRLAGAKFHGSYIKLAVFYGAFLHGAIVNSSQWIEDYHKMNPRLRTFRLDQYSLVEGKDENGDRIYFINGPDPALKAKKPKL
ncbi:pentapeptide repeat-containing protein [Gimesia aquarii]|uniref:pentapeptide repeat-containing protein n=1 Tax=Gimesia aquarii TaxID=2527964 RepID=UPI0018D927C1|nr:pentapeptide repeat-containing protein [Gimesia aquarii]